MQSFNNNTKCTRSMDNSLSVCARLDYNHATLLRCDNVTLVHSISGDFSAGTDHSDNSLCINTSQCYFRHAFHLFHSSFYALDKQRSPTSAQPQPLPSPLQSPDASGKDPSEDKVLSGLLCAFPKRNYMYTSIYTQSWKQNQFRKPLIEDCLRILKWPWAFMQACQYELVARVSEMWSL